MFACLALPADAQRDCPTASLPAYAHNDYRGSRPLADALRLGYRGVEADAFLIEGTLRLGHDRSEAEQGPRLDSAYLVPLAAIVARCGRLTGAAEPPFLLLLELKERSPATLDSARALLARQGPWLSLAAGARGVPVQVVMVGSSDERSNGAMARQHRIDRWGSPPTDAAVLLLSLDYGKTIGRLLSMPGRRRAWLEALRRDASSKGTRLVRVHNVPADGAVYAELLAAGVDLIGTTDLTVTSRLLAARTTGGTQPNR